MFSAFTGRPHTSTVPWPVSSPFKCRAKVVFPLPLAPRRATVSPASRRKSTPLSATVPSSYWYLSPRTRISGDITRPSRLAGVTPRGLSRQKLKRRRLPDESVTRREDGSILENRAPAWRGESLRRAHKSARTAARTLPPPRGLAPPAHPRTPP